ncbi:MAG: DUF4105 domain-containing protein [Myxococcales bacterium]|nr:DUF4105 domain-containing protein [Myxococcales bacterium]MCB9531573.1 DUF4105 domain-containing protein [Myxococcales bacterium]MCB9532776.1 DUF4105 domain-containing protein [Myxococcales bacterium]
MTSSLPATDPATGSRVRRWLRNAVGVIVSLLLALVGGCALLFVGGSGAPTVLRWVLAAVFALTCLASPWSRSARRRPNLGVAMVLFGLVWLWWLSVAPSNDRSWSEPQSRAAWAEIDGDRVTVHDLRRFRYLPSGDYVAAWDDVELNLQTLQRADFVLTRFSDVEGVGHVMVSFEFDSPSGAEHFVVSAEIRREQGEEFDPLRGLFRQYELIYVVADELDAIGLRTLAQGDPTWVIPVDATPEHVRAFFVDAMARATALRSHPEWYNTLTSSCATNLERHYEHVAGRRLGLDYRVILPGYSDQVLGELGLLPEGVDVAAARERYRVNEAARADGGSADFSRRIRAGH